MFKNFFFFVLNVDLSDINNFTYAKLLTLTKSINKNEINNAIAKLKADKAFETDQILNQMLKMLRKTMTKKLIFIFQACIDVEYHSKIFRKSITIVFKKIKKSDYTSLKVYRLIALLNTINKMLKLIMINKITELAKNNLLLSKLQINAKKEKKNRNYAENVKEKNTRNIKTKQRQNNHDHERECSENIKSRIACYIITQSEKKKNIKLNNSMN